MSIFNTVVQPHKLAPILLNYINWAQPDDLEKKYPLLGRMRYVWLTEDYKQIKLLLKDGPSSWSEEKDEILNQIKTHETFVSVEPLDRDDVYLVATFNPINAEEFNVLFENFKEIEEELVVEIPEYVFITKHPFDIFDEEMKKMESGEKMSPKIEKLAESLKDMFSEIKVEDELKTMTDDTKISGFDTTKVKILTVDSEGNLEDKTEKFKDGKNIFGSETKE